MSTTHDQRPGESTHLPRSPRRSKSGLYRFTVEQVDKLAEMGFFDGRHVELIDGILFEMTTNPPHCISSELVTLILMRLFGGHCRVRVGLPLHLGRRTLAEPDFAVVAGSPRDDPKAHPTMALLALEVSDSTLRKDRTIKGHLYARSGIADYWVVNLQDRQLEVHRDPGPDPDRKGRFRYAEVTIVGADGHASPLALPEARIAVADMLP